MFRALLIVAIAAVSLSCAHVSTREAKTQSPPERVFWEMCFDEDGQPLLPSDSPPHKANPDCEKTFTLKFPSLPIHVRIADGSEAALPYVLGSLESWNRAVGFELFALAQLDSEVDIVIFKEGAHPFLAGKAWPMLVDGEVKSVVFLYNDYWKKTDTIMHELGHAIGLAHDVDDEFSIMYPGPSPMLPAVQREDVWGLRMKYLGR